MNTYYYPQEEQVWCGRAHAQQDEYIYQLVKLLDLNQPTTMHSKHTGYTFLGFASDLGIQRNQGRIGAAQGPQTFKQVFAKCAAPYPISIYDAGHIAKFADDLEGAQQQLGQCVQQILKLNSFPIIIGGGHETAWGHFQGIEDFYPQSDDIALLNFDAHFDLRAEPQAHSGNSFRQIYQLLTHKHRKFHYYCIGIQKYANTKSLFDFAHQNQVQYRYAEEINQAPQKMDLIHEMIERHSKIFVSICLDVFAAHLAPGVSSPQVMGITAEYPIQALKLLKRSNKVTSLEIVELSPPYDIDQRTAKLASHLLMEYMFS